MKIRISLAFALALSTNLALAAVPTNPEDLSNTTLTNLYEEGLISIESAYQLEEVTDENPASDFSITKFWNDNGTLKAVDFNVVFNEMIGSGEPSSFYKWEVVSGKLSLVAGAENDYDIEAGAEGVISERQEIARGTTTAFDSNFVGISSTDNGGAIYNSGTISSITGHFIGNNILRASAYGGAINNSMGTISNITGDFIENYASASSTYAYGGAIYNYNNAKIGDITGDFIGNYATASNNANGGAISNTSTIGDITGNFIKNYATSSNNSAYGGAIYSTTNTIGDIMGDFIGNYATGANNSVYGGAICNYTGTITSITGDFIGNYATGTTTTSLGGAIYNYFGTISSITGDFIGNYATGTTARGGAICNDKKTITIREGSSFTGNYVSTDGGVTKSFEAIYNYSNSENSPATINLNAYDSSKSIIVNDGINGNADYIAYQKLEINNTASDVSYGTVEFNSFVNNQTVNVHNGSLKLGSFAGATLDVNGTELVVAATSASLTNTDINVKDGATLLVASNATMNSSSNINLESGSELNIAADASLSLDDSSTLAAAGYSISTPAESEVELAMLSAEVATVNEAPASSISGNNATLSTDKIENATISNLAISASADMELKNSTLSNGTSVQASGASEISLNNVALTTGSILGDAVATSLANGLTMTGTLDSSELTLTSLTYNISSLGDAGKKEGEHILFEMGTTQLIFDVEDATDITSTENFSYAWGINNDGDIVLNSTLTTIVVSGVSYDAVAGWTLAVSEDQYELLDLNSNSFSGNFLFSEEALAQFELVKGLEGTPEWMESYSVTDGNYSVASTDLTNSANLTMNGVAAENGKYRVAYIPEPSTVTLSLLALAGLAARRRRKVA